MNSDIDLALCYGEPIFLEFAECYVQWEISCSPVMIRSWDAQVMSVLHIRNFFAFLYNIN